MNRPPEIIINSGYVTDANGVLTELVIPSSVTTQNAPSIITTYATILNWIPDGITQLNCKRVEALTLENMFRQKPFIHASFDKCVSITTNSTTNATYNGTFSGCTNLQSINMPELVEIAMTTTRNQDSRTVGTFAGCTGLLNVYMPKLERLLYTRGTWSNYDGVFYNCLSLSSIILPKIKTIEQRTFNTCTGLTSVQLGSAGNPVTSIASDAFRSCTQSGLTITIYTTNGTSLANEPWGATNEDTDIIYEVA